MVKASELRIGNYVKQGDEIIEWNWSLLADGVNTLFNAAGSELSVDPIPLNEKWIRQFGYYTEITGKGTEVESIPFYSNDSFLTLDWKTLEPSWEGIELNIKLEFVHQLQNLYFSLTREELQIK